MIKDVQLIFGFLIVLGFESCSNPNNDVQQHEENDPVVKTILDNGINVAFLILDGVYNTELTAPMDIFEHTKYREGVEPMNCFTISNTTNPILTSEGLIIIPDFDYHANYPEIDILVVPSTEFSTSTDLENQEMIAFVQEVDRSATFVTSHCDGAFVLAEAGLLDSVHCTTYPGDCEEMQNRFPATIVHDSVLFVHDGKYITSAGGAKSFEAALYLVEHLYGKQNADEIAEGMVIDWRLEAIPYLKFD